MHPDSQSLEAAFEPTSATGGASGASPRDQAVEDFNAFFEKLSALDSLQWSAESPARSAGAAADARPAPKAAAPAGRAAAAAKAAKPRMTVVKSDTDLDAVPPMPDAMPRPTRATTGDVARFLKMILVGLLLFGLGLGAGWAALSLPGHFEPRMPSFAELMERTRAVTQRMENSVPSTDPLRVVETGHNGAVNGGTTPPATAPAAKAATLATPAAKGKAGKTASAPPAAAPTAKTASAPAPATQATAMMPAAPAEDGADAVTDGGNDIQLPVVSHDGSTAAPATPAASTTTVAPTAATQAGTASANPELRFSLQVGACTSYACVESYRHLLLSKVSSHSIKVLTQPRAAGGESIQRIRIQPLSRDEAERLKGELAAMDARFKGAYVLSLH